MSRTITSRRLCCSRLVCATNRDLQPAHGSRHHTRADLTCFVSLCLNCAHMFEAVGCTMELNRVRFTAIRRIEQPEQPRRRRRVTTVLAAHARAENCRRSQPRVAPCVAHVKPKSARPPYKMTAFGACVSARYRSTSIPYGMKSRRLAVGQSSTFSCSY